MAAYGSQKFSTGIVGHEACQIISLSRMIIGVISWVCFARDLIYILCSSDAVDKLTTQGRMIRIVEVS